MYNYNGNDWMLLLLMNKISCLIKVTHKIKNNLKIKKHIGVEKR